MELRKAVFSGKSDDELMRFCIVSSDNDYKRFDWDSGKFYTERLDINGADVSELKTFFKDHAPSVDNAIGAVTKTEIIDGELFAFVRFASDADSQKIAKKYEEGVSSDVSIGYTISKLEKSDDIWTARSFKIHELSAVWKGADKGAKMRQCERINEIHAQNLARKIKLKSKEIQ